MSLLPKSIGLGARNMSLELMIFYSPLPSCVEYKADMVDSWFRLTDSDDLYSHLLLAG